jgi:hypothetical protein
LPVEVAAFADDVATEGFTVFFRRIELAAADSDVVAHGDRQRIHHVSGLLGVLVLEDFGQHIEECSPEGWIYGVQPSVEATLGDRLLDVTILLQKRAARLDVAGEEGCSYKRYGHHLGGGQTDLWVVAVAYCLQELLAQVVGSDYGIFQWSSRSTEKVLGGLQIGRILAIGVGGNLGYEWLYVYAFVRPATGEVHWLILPRVNVEVFSMALKHFAKEVGASKERRILLVLDRAGWHTGKEVEVPEGIHLEFLPSHSPELQPTERLWPLDRAGRPRGARWALLAPAR